MTGVQTCALPIFHSFTLHRAEGQDFNPTYVDSANVDVKVSGSDVEVYGAAYVYKPIKRLDVFAAFNNFSLESEVGSYEDVDIAMVGSRLRF